MNNNTQSEDLVKQLTTDIQRVTAEVRRTKGTEEDLKIGIQRLFDDILSAYGLEPETRYERIIYRSRRADTLYPAVVIEYKKPGELAKARIRRKAVDELTDYLKGMSRQETLLRKHVGIAIDGEQVLFVRASPTSSKTKTVQATLDRVQVLVKQPEIIGPRPINYATVEQIVLYLRQLRRRTLRAEYLNDDFGSGSDIASKGIYLLYTRLSRSDKPKVRLLFSEWDRIFGIVYGEKISRAKEDAKELAKLYHIVEEADLKRLLFCIHTYFAILMKTLAAEVLSLYYRGLLSSFVTMWSDIDDKALHESFVHLETGGTFRDLGIQNFLEGDFFSWYLEEWDGVLADFIRGLVRKLANYEPATPRIDPDEVKDLLKRLYQYLVPQQLRHDLGEYYTPDWLAELLLLELDYDGDVEKRVLDPACGSGTFLIAAIRKIKERMEDFPEKHDEQTVFDHIRRNIVGFDINPLAVLAARTNYLIAVADIRKGRDLEIPIYLADSINIPTKKDEEEEFVISTRAGEFPIHATIAHKGTITKILSILDEVVETTNKFEVFYARIKDILPDERAHDSLGKLFALMNQLHQEGKNRVWTRIVKNNMAPHFVIQEGKFDYIIGNPPWVNWQNLSADYRLATSSLWWKYGLFQHRGLAARLGGGKIDFSMLFLYASIDRFLKKHGNLGFVITQTVFKTAGVAGSHFRRFQIGNGERAEKFKVMRVHDLVDLEPFEDATNRTSIMIVQNAERTGYPVPYTRWIKKRMGKKESHVGSSFSLRRVLESSQVLDCMAVPINENDSSSPWLTAPPRLLKVMRKAIGPSEYVAHEGSNTLGLNSVYWIRIIEKAEDNTVLIRNLHDIGDREVRPVRAKVETEFIYPLLRGRDISRWDAKPSECILLMHDPVSRKGYDETIVQTRYPRTYSYLKMFEAELTARPMYHKFFWAKRKDADGTEEEVPQAPFYTMYGVGDYTLGKYKVCWKEQADGLVVAVASPSTDKFFQARTIVPDHKVFFASCRNELEAHYLCAILNSPISSSIVRAYTIPTQLSTHILTNLAIPKFDKKNRTHKMLSELSMKAHAHAAKGEQKELAKIESRVNTCAGRLWSFTPKDLNFLNN